MDEQKASKIAEVFNGQVWNSGGGIHLVCIERADGHLVVISDEVICEYDNQEAFEDNNPGTSIILH